MPRPRLVDQITAGVEGALTLITAPAGFGKTSLFAAWRSSPAGQRHHVAWLSLDADDDEPARFLRYLAGALETAMPGAFGQVTMMFRLPQLPPVKTVLAAFLNCLAPMTAVGASAPHDSLVLALDDYHVLENPEIHQAVEYLLEHLPPCLHLVILSRADPPLRLARLKAGGQLTEIRASALRFTPEETAQFLNHVMRLELPPADIAMLDTRTEGWVAGLKLAALRLAEPGLGRHEASRFIRTFGTNHRFAAGFLVEEVVSRQPPAVQEFLLRSSILERMCAPLCDRLMQAVDGHGPNTPWPSEEVIEHLVHRNLFVVPLDDEGCWYRYHHLFRDMLRARLGKVRPAHAMALHRAAAEWYEGQDLLKEAVKHAILTADWDYAADVVERHGVATLGHSDIRTLDGWLGAFPDDVVRRRPVLAIFHAWVLTLSYNADCVPAIDVRLAQAEQALSDPRTPQCAPLAQRKDPLPLHPWILGNVIQLRASRMLWPSCPDFNAHKLISLARQSMELLSGAGDGATDTVNFLNLSHAHMALTDAKSAEETLTETLRRTLEGDNYYGHVTAVFYLAHLAYSQGRLDRVEELCTKSRDALNAALGDPEQKLPAIRSLDVAMGCVYLERNRLADAEAALRRALDLFGWAPWVEVAGYVALLRLRIAQADYPGVLSALAGLERLGPDVQLETRMLRIFAKLRTSPGDPDALAAASDWAKLFKPDLDQRPPMPIGRFQSIVGYETYLAWAHVMVILGDARAALKFADPAAALAQEQGLLTRLIELSLVQALAHNVLGESRRSMDALERALAAAEPCGHLRTFDQGEQLSKLMAEAAARGLRPTQIRSILDAIGWSPAASGDTTRQPRLKIEGELVEPLSEREQEVLELVAAGLSNVEIAARLYIGIGTVKTHLNHLFGKLGASSRTQLLARARMLKLLH